MKRMELLENFRPHLQYASLSDRVRLRLDSPNPRVVDGHVLERGARGELLHELHAKPRPHPPPCRTQALQVAELAAKRAAQVST